MITDEDLPKIVSAYEEAGGVKARAAAKLGLPISTYKDAYLRAELKNLTGNTFMDGPTKFGHHTGLVTTHYKNVAGDIQPVESWVRELPDSFSTADVMEQVREALIGFEHAPAIETPAKPTITDLQATYVITDEHLGLYSWARQTGQNYDLDIAERALLGSTYRLMQQTPEAEQALILKLGDTFHMDNPRNITERGGNQLDVDTRYEKVLQQGVKVLVRMIDMAAAKHPFVKVKIVRGNHDPNTSFALAVILKEHYRNTDHIDIDTSPAPFAAFEWGKVMIGVHHGDTVKAQDFPMTMAAIWPEMWGRTQYRYAYSGHLHRTQKGKIITGDEIGGAEWEIFQAVAARDQWSASMGFTSKRSMTSIMHHKEYGERGRARTYITGE